MKGQIPKDLFDILACPLCLAELNYSKDYKYLICVKCKEKYPINNGVPNLLVPKK